MNIFERVKKFNLLLGEYAVYCPDRLQLIKDAVIINGGPFVRIEEVLACKSFLQRLL